MKGRRGQIPILMLFLVAIILVIVALVSFSNSSSVYAEASTATSKTIAAMQFGQDYSSEKAKDIVKSVWRKYPGAFSDEVLKGEFMDISNKSDIGVIESGNFFAKLREGNFIFEKFFVAELMPNPGYHLNMTGLFVQAESGNNKIRQDYDLCMLFDTNGGYMEKSANKEVYFKKCGA